MSRKLSIFPPGWNSHNSSVNHYIPFHLKCNGYLKNDENSLIAEENGKFPTNSLYVVLRYHAVQHLVTRKERLSAVRNVQSDLCDEFCFYLEHEGRYKSFWFGFSSS